MQLGLEDREHVAILKRVDKVIHIKKVKCEPEEGEARLAGGMRRKKKLARVEQVAQAKAQVGTHLLAL